MAAAMSAPSPGGEYVGWQSALTWRPSAHALFDGASSAAGGEWEESEHPADLRKYNGGHGHTGSSTNFSAITKQTWIVAVMKRFSLESSTNHSGTALQPVDVVRSAVECASPSIPEEQRAAWVARVKKWVATPDARNQIRGAAATEYREDMSRRGMRHVGDPAAALFPEMEKALMEKCTRPSRRARSSPRCGSAPTRGTWRAGSTPPRTPRPSAPVSSRRASHG